MIFGPVCFSTIILVDAEKLPSNDMLILFASFEKKLLFSNLWRVLCIQIRINEESGHTPLFFSFLVEYLSKYKMKNPEKPHFKI